MRFDFHRGPALMLSLAIAVGLASSTYAQDEGQRQGPSDQGIADQIERELAIDQGVAAYKVDVNVTDGVATLSGQVNNILAKQRATRIATTVRGVRSVVNNILVAPTPRSDKQIRQDIREALVLNPAAESWETEVRVDDGAVTIRGTVDSWTEKRMAGRIARSVRGVRAVQNKITIDMETNRTDAQIRAEIDQALDWDVNVDDALIDVAVDDGAVMLSGVVGSAAEKNLAIANAYVAGVDSVSADELVVQPWAKDDKLAGEKFVDRPDQAIAEAVKDALLFDPRVNAFNVEVSVDNGVAVLRGNVDTLFARRAAASDARNTVGVWRVKNRLKVRGEKTPTDAQIKADVIASIERDPYLERQDISVSVVGGEVYLAGEVETFFQKTRADDAAARVPGVVEVNNNLVVADTWDPMTPSPYVDDLIYTPEGSRYVLPEGFDPAKSDWAIQQDIRDELWWSPFVDAGEVNVSVDDGVARLTGTVDTWSEREAAETNALEAGAIDVDNDLSVEFGPEYYQPEE